MGCQQSDLSKIPQIDEEIPSKQSKLHNVKRNKNAKIHGRHSFSKIYENINKLIAVKTIEDMDFIQKAISKHFFLFKLSRHERKEVANAMELFQTREGEYVFQQGTPASMFFIIEEGEVQIEIGGEMIKKMNRGNVFGQLAIIYSSPRSASVKALTYCKFWCLNQNIFLKLQRELVKSNYKLAKPHVNKLPIFNFLTTKQKDEISFHMNALRYEAHETIFKTGDDATSFYVIMNGKVEITIPDKAPLYLKNGESFGESCLKSGSIRSGSATCMEKTQLMAIGAQDLKTCLGGGHSEFEIMFHNIIKWALRRSSQITFSNIISQQKFIESGSIVLKKDGEIIATKGEIDENIYICLQGKISGIEKGIIINQTLIEDQATAITEQTLIKEEDGSIFILPRKNIPKYSAKLKKIVSTASIMTKKDCISGKISTNHNIQNTFKDLYILCKLGEGQMGKVFLVQNRKTEKRYALKCVQKNQVIKSKMQKFLIAEKQILDIVDFPFIVKLVQTYRDSHFIYFLLNYIEGGDFFQFLADIGECTTNIARFYFACLLLSIEYLHKNNIVYRDLKPENAALDANGYLNLIDMGTAKQLSADAECGLRTFTIIGTPHYMAPQVFEAKGYSFPVDIWSLGIVMYQIVCGILPFGTYTDDPVSVYKQIDKNNLKFPKNYQDEHGKELIRRLLQRNPSKRSVQDFSDIKYMDYFKSFNWKLLESQQMVAPVRPKLTENKERGKSQYLLNYLQKQKLKMEKPVASSHHNWDECF